MEGQLYVNDTVSDLVFVIFNLAGLNAYSMYQISEHCLAIYQLQLLFFTTHACAWTDIWFESATIKLLKDQLYVNGTIFDFIFYIEMILINNVLI